MKKVIVVNLGNKGVVLSIQGDNAVFDKLFIDEFNQNTLPTVLDFFQRYNKLDAYIVLDTVAQNYNYKIFPPLNYFDLIKVVNRRFNTEIPKNDLKHKQFLYKDHTDKRSMFLFVSASVDSPLKEWFSFFQNVPNNLLGVYLLPLESVEFARKIMISSDLKERTKIKNNWILITFNDQTSDLRQVAIFNNKVAFTRLISLDGAGIDLANFAKNDIIRTSEYIRRFDSEFTFEKLTIINILDKENIETLKSLKIEKSLILNYTPYNVAELLKIGRHLIEENEKYCDLILSLFIFKNSSRVRFANTKINLVYEMSFFFNILIKFIIFIFLLIWFSFGGFVVLNMIFNGRITNLNGSIKDNEKILQSKSEEQFGMDSSEVDKIINAGLLKDILDLNYVDPIPGFKKFSEAQADDSLTHDLKWSLEGFDYQKINDGDLSIKSVYNVSIINPDGDANKLFKKYDAFSSHLKSIYKDDIKTLSTLPSNINFSKKYLTYPINIEILEKK